MTSTSTQILSLRVRLLTHCFKNRVHKVNLPILLCLSTLGRGGDYGALANPTLLRFGACETRQCVTIQIINDDRLEETESFNVSLEGAGEVNSTFILDPQQAVIYITDEDFM